MVINMKITKTLIALTLLISASAHAVSPIPDRDGFGGFMSLGLGVASVESNFLAEVIGQDLSDENISSLGSPDSESIALPLVAFELSYVFDGKTQLFVGNLLEDYLQFDFSTRFGVRQDLGSAGLGSVALLASPTATKVWENPYATGVDRDSTDRTASGIRLSWDKIMGTGLEIRVSTREIDIDDEESGTGLIPPLSQPDIDSLDRNGDQNTINVRYLFGDSKTSKFLVGVSSTEADLDGDAMSYDSTSFELTWLYTPDKNLKVVTNLVVGSKDYDEVHPVFGEKADSDIRMFSVTGFFPGLWGFKDWVPNALLVVGGDDSDVSFFDSKVTIVGFGFLNRF
jgi:hypothetical protein